MNGKKLEEKNLVVKANVLIENKSSLTVTEQKIVLCLISMINPNDKDFCKYILKISDFMKIAGIKDKSSYNRIHNATEKLMRKIIKIKLPNSFLQLSWFSSVEYFYGEGKVELEFSPKLKPFLLKLKEQFTRYQLKNIIKLKSFYSIRLYELLKQYELFNKRVFEIKELREMLGIKDTKYLKYNNFKRKILLVAQKEISEKTDLIISFSEIKEHRKIIKIKFIIKSKKKQVNSTQNNLALFPETNQFPSEILKALPEKYQINTIYNLIKPYFDNPEYLTSNIKYSNKHCKDNYPAYLKLALEKDYAKTEREVKEKKTKIIQEKKNKLQKKQNQEKLLKQKAWKYFNSLPETKQFELKAEATEKMSAALKFIKIPERKNDIINAQIEKDLIVKIKG